MQNINDFPLSIITVILAVLLFVFLRKKEMSTQIKIDMTKGLAYQYELKFYVSLNTAEEETEDFVCCSDCCYKNPLAILKKADLIKNGYLILPKGQEIILIRTENIRKITMNTQKMKQ